MIISFLLMTARPCLSSHSVWLRVTQTLCAHWNPDIHLPGMCPQAPHHALHAPSLPELSAHPSLRLLLGTPSRSEAHLSRLIHLGVFCGVTTLGPGGTAREELNHSPLNTDPEPTGTISQKLVLLWGPIPTSWEQLPRVEWGTWLWALWMMKTASLTTLKGPRTLSPME